MFQNQASGATFQNLLPDAIFCDYASDVYHEWHSVGNDMSLIAMKHLHMTHILHGVKEIPFTWIQSTI